MKKNLPSILLTILFIAASSQMFSQATQATLLGTWGDDNLIPTSAFNGRYNDVWGVTQNNREYAIIGSTAGVHFIEVTNPTNPVELKGAFIPGAAQGPALIHRDFHDHNGYLYVVADEGQSTLQVVDISGLPDTSVIVYDSNEFFTTAHNVFVDNQSDRLYVLGGDYGQKGLAVYSLADPTNPVEMASYPTDGAIPYCHDGYARDNIAYLNCGSSGGFQIWDLNDPKNPILIDKLTTYPQQGYNHSGWLDEVGHYYFMADETFGMDLKVLDVCGSGGSEGITVETTFDTGSGIPSSIPHNLIVRCNLLFVSYYHEGLQVFDISDPLNPELVSYYDTYSGPDANTYQGAWGIYPLFPSGISLISDMQTGLYIFDAIPSDCDAYSAKACGDTSTTVSVKELPQNLDITIFPQPASQQLGISLTHPGSNTDLLISFFNSNGQLMQQEKRNIISGENTIQLDLNDMVTSGMHFLKLQGSEINIIEKVVIQR